MGGPDLSIELNFASINAEQTAFTQIIVDFVLNINQLKELGIRNCTQPLSINSPHLKEFWANYNPGLTSLALNCPGLIKLTFRYNPVLSSLDLSGCPQLRKFEAIFNQKLRSLNLRSCRILESFKAFENPILYVIDLRNCPSIRIFENAAKNPSLISCKLHPQAFISQLEQENIKAIVAENRKRLGVPAEKVF